MDGHVHEDAAGNLDVIHGLVVRVARGDLDNIGLAQAAGSHGVADHLVVVVKAADKTDLELDAGLLDSVERFFDLCEVGVDRLLAEDVLAGPGSAHDELCVRVGGRADEHGFDRGIAEDLLRIVVALLNAHVCRPRTGSVVHERVGDRVQLRFRHCVRQIFPMQLADSAGTQQTNAYFFHFHALSFIV